MEQKIINLSATSVNCYLNSPLEYYYTYIQKAQPDTQVPEVYGVAGTIVHKMIEEGTDNQEYFTQMWLQEKLHETPGLFNRYLKADEYFSCVQNGLKKVKDLYPLSYEDSISIPLLNQNNVEISVKGFIDLIAISKDGSCCIYDWKTSSSISKDGSHERQALMYAYLVYSFRGFIPAKIVFEYLKIDKSVEYTFTEEQVLEFHDLLLNIAEFISSNINDESAFLPGNYDHIFNRHKQKCQTAFEKLMN